MTPRAVRHARSGGCSWRRPGVVIPLLYGFLLAAVMVLPATGQPTQQWRERNDLGNRHEGLIDLPTGGADLLPLSFFGYREGFTSAVTLYVRYFMAEARDHRIFSRELTDLHHYWMESKMLRGDGGGWREWGPWPTADVILRERVATGNLGFLIRPERREGEPLVLIPAFIHHSTPPDALSGYTLVLRPGRKLKNVSWEVRRVGDDAAEPCAHGTDRAPRWPGVPFAIELPAAGLEAGWLKLLLHGEVPNRRDPVAFTFRFFHQPGLSRDSSDEQSVESED